MKKNISSLVKNKSKMNYDLDLLKDMYKKMLLIRRFEEKAGQLYGMGKIGGFCHLYIGQEAVVVGIQSAQIEGDSIVTSYRDHGHMIACDMDPKGVMAELTGREDGYSKGKGGSMHMFSREKGFFGERSLWKIFSLNNQISLAKKEYGILLDKKVKTSSEINLLRDNNLDPDIISEIAHKLLGLIHSDQIVIDIPK